jgi:hypothetical protein
MVASISAARVLRRGAVVGGIVFGLAGSAGARYQSGALPLGGAELTAAITLMGGRRGLSRGRWCPFRSD